MSFLKPSASPAPTIPLPELPAAPPPVMQPQGTKPGAKNQRTTFLGSSATANPVQSSGSQMGKTLLGT